MKNTIHPDDIFKSLKIASVRSQKIKNLETLHSLCSAQYQGSKDYSLPVIGKLWEATGGIMARALYNAASKDYRTLISAWDKYAGPSKPSVSTQNADSKNPNYLARIEDPAIRSLVQAVLIERDKLKAEVNLLKSFSSLTVDLSPKIIFAAPSDKASLFLEETKPFKLTPSEIEAVERALSSKHLDSEGWKEGPNGEVLNERGRRIFEAGFTQALRKTLKAAQRQQKRGDHGI